MNLRSFVKRGDASGASARGLGLLPLLLVSLSGCARTTNSDSAPAVSVAAAVPAPPPSALAAPPAPATLIEVGQPAPAVTFHLQTGETQTLASLRGKPVVVYFYPKDDTPGCTVEAQEIRDLYAAIQKTGAVVIGVSTNPRGDHQAFAEKHALPFSLASDESGDVAKAFGVPLTNGRAKRVTFIIDGGGKVTRVFPSVTPKGHGAEVLAALTS